MVSSENKSTIPENFRPTTPQGKEKIMRTTFLIRVPHRKKKTQETTLYPVSFFETNKLLPNQRKVLLMTANSIKQVRLVLDWLQASRQKQAIAIAEADTTDALLPIVLLMLEYQVPVIVCSENGASAALESIAALLCGNRKKNRVGSAEDFHRAREKATALLTK